jgi:hypothetical protein
MSMASIGADLSSYLARLDYVLAGAKPYPWAAAHGLSRGAIGRMLKGQLPDPEKMVPLVRSEGLSLSWLLTGQGTPYLVHCPSSDAQGADLVRQLAEEMGKPGGVLLRNADNQDEVVAVLAEPAAKAALGAEAYIYRHGEVIGGQVLREHTAQAVMDTCQNPKSRIIDGSKWRRLSSGYMALSELWTLIDTQPKRFPRPQPLPEIAAAPPRIETVSDLSDWEREILESLRGVPQSVRDTVAAMVKAAAEAAREK